MNNRNRCRPHCSFVLDCQLNRSHRSVPESRLACILILQVCLSLLLSNTSIALDVQLTSSQRAGILQRASELAECIVVATLLDTTYVIGSDEIIWTRYTARVDQRIKGDVLPDSTMVFAERGGAIGARTDIMFDSYPFQLGEQYLLFLASCPSEPDRRVICRACNTRIEQEMAYTHNPFAEVPTAALIDSVEAFLEVCSVEYQLARSDLIITGTIDDVTHSREGVPIPYANTSLDVTVGQVLLQRREPEVGSGNSISVAARAVQGGQSQVEGTKPTLEPQGTYLLFLEYETTGWVLRNSAYAAWKKVESEGLVEAWSFPCGHVIEKRGWDDLVTEVTQ